jgi:hypothetical protein
VGPGGDPPTLTLAMRGDLHPAVESVRFASIFPSSPSFFYFSPLLSLLGPVLIADPTSSRALCRTFADSEEYVDVEVERKEGGRLSIGEGVVRPSSVSLLPSSSLHARSLHTYALAPLRARTHIRGVAGD